MDPGCRWTEQLLSDYGFDLIAENFYFSSRFTFTFGLSQTRNKTFETPSHHLNPNPTKTITLYLQRFHFSGSFIPAGTMFCLSYDDKR